MAGARPDHRLVDLAVLFLLLLNSFFLRLLLLTLNLMLKLLRHVDVELRIHFVVKEIAGGSSWV